MENTNKPQWLIDAENEIKNFEDSKYGKMNNGQLTRSINGKLVTSNSYLQSKKGIKGGISIMNKMKKQGTLKEYQSSAAKIANAKPERIEKFKNLKTKEHQTNAAKVANSKLLICPDGYVTTATSVTRYCKIRNLDFNNCILFNGTHSDIINSVCLQLNVEFTTTEFINVCKLLNYYDGIFDYAKKENMITCIHLGVKGSNKNVAIYKKNIENCQKTETITDI